MQPIQKLARVQHIQDLLGIEVPLLLAPMANAAGNALASAVTNSGGLGSLPCASWCTGRIRSEVDAYRSSASSTVLNLNFFAHSPQRNPAITRQQDAQWMGYLQPEYQRWEVSPSVSVPPGPSRNSFDDDAFQVLCEVKPSAVSFHFGLPRTEVLDAIRVACPGIVILSSATTVEEAAHLASSGVDVVICQGIGAGGHRGHFLSTDVSHQPTTRDLVRGAAGVVGKVPIVAAGGIGFPCDVAEMILAGAAAVQVGTAFLLAPEAAPNPYLKKRLTTAAEEGTPIPTVLTRAFTGGVARGFPTPYTEGLQLTSEFIPSFPDASAALAPLRARAEAVSDDRFTPMFAGNGRIQSGRSAADVVNVLVGSFRL